MYLAYLHHHPLPPCPPPGPGDAIFFLALFAALPIGALAFRHWRKGGAHGAVLFVVYVLCALFMVDMLALSFVLAVAPLPPTRRS